MRGELMKRKVIGSKDDASIGIWWYIEDSSKVIGYSKPLDAGYLDRMYVQYDRTSNHMNMWKQCVSDFLNNDSTIYKKGYKSLYRGRVIYCPMTMSYIVNCSEELRKNSEFRDAILQFFNLRGCRYDFQPLEHYRNKLELTGDPAVDSQYYEV